MTEERQERSLRQPAPPERVILRVLEPSDLNKVSRDRATVTTGDLYRQAGQIFNPNEYAFARSTPCWQLDRFLVTTTENERVLFTPGDVAPGGSRRQLAWGAAIFLDRLDPDGQPAVVRVPPQTQLQPLVVGEIWEDVGLSLDVAEIMVTSPNANLHIIPLEEKPLVDDLSLQRLDEEASRLGSESLHTLTRFVLEQPI